MIYHWERFAACRGLPREWFFDHERDQTIKVPEAAQKACRNCPVRDSCLAHALRYEMYGYWSGTTRGERVRMRRLLGVTIRAAEGIAIYHEGDVLFPSN